MVGQAFGLLRRSRVLLALVAVELFWGFGMVTFESLLPVRLAEVVGDPERAAALLGPAGSAAWLAIGGRGAALTPLLLRRPGAAPGAALLRILQGATVVGMGLLAGPVGVLVAYLACYTVHGASNPLHLGLLHRQVDGPYRTSVLSLNSMMAQPAGALGAVALTALADAQQRQHGDGGGRGGARRRRAALPARLAGRGTPADPAGPRRPRRARGAGGLDRWQEGARRASGDAGRSTVEIDERTGWVHHDDHRTPTGGPTCSPFSRPSSSASPCCSTSLEHQLRRARPVQQLAPSLLHRPAAALALPGRRRQRPARRRRRPLVPGPAPRAAADRKRSPGSACGGAIPASWARPGTVFVMESDALFSLGEPAGSAQRRPTVPPASTASPGGRPTRHWRFACARLDSTSWSARIICSRPAPRCGNW